jgi:hypothetical protein
MTPNYAQMWCDERRTDRKGLDIVPFEHLRNNSSLVLIGNHVTFENWVQILTLSVTGLYQQVCWACKG